MINILQITNAESGTSQNDGLQFRLSDNNAVIYNREAGDLTMLNKINGNKLKLAQNGSLSIGTNTQSHLFVSESGNVGVGTDEPEYRLDVAGIIRGCKVYAEAGAYCWPDYVFDDSYDLMSISDLEHFIKLNRHLPSIPDAETVNSKEVDLLKMNRDLLEKVEELTLYVIDLQEQIDELKTNNMKSIILLIIILISLQSLAQIKYDKSEFCTMNDSSLNKSKISDLNKPIITVCGLAVIVLRKQQKIILRLFSYASKLFSQTFLNLQYGMSKLSS